MNDSNRLIINTVAQYARTVINIALSLYSSRLILQLLGESDFGLYALIGGVVAFLSFLTNSLASSTQRFLSVSQGERDICKTKLIFANSIIVHIFIGVLLVFILELLCPLLLDYTLKIPVGREHAAMMVYHQVVLMVFVTLLSSPYRAVLISRENIVYVSIIDVLNGALKLLFVFMLFFCSLDKLIMYGWAMFGISMFNLFSYSTYSMLKYNECTWPKRKYINVDYIKNLVSFTGWTMYSSLCVVGRVQGVAVVLNNTMGTVANAAFGIGASLQGYISFLASSLSNAIAPQLMKAKGAEETKKMLYLAFFQCKMSYLLFSLLAIPSMFEISDLLKFWLNNVPENTNVFAVLFLLTMLVDMLTTGLGTAVNAIGKVKVYSLIVFTPKLLVVPLSAITLIYTSSLWYLVFIFVIMEFIGMLLRILCLKRIIKFDLNYFFEYTFLKTLIPVLLSTIICFLISRFMSFTGRFLITFFASGVILTISSYIFSLTQEEKIKVNSLIKKLVIKCFTR